MIKTLCFKSVLVCIVQLYIHSQAILCHLLLNQIINGSPILWEKKKKGVISNLQKLVNFSNFIFFHNEIQSLYKDTVRLIS